MTTPAAAVAPVDRIQKLIALSSSPSLEEARTAALLACQLIREHKLIIREKEPWDELGITKEDLKKAYQGNYSDTDDAAAEAVAEVARKAAEQARREMLRKMNAVYGKMSADPSIGHLDDESLEALRGFFARFDVGFARNTFPVGSYNASSGLFNTRGATLAQALRFALASLGALRRVERDEEDEDDSSDDVSLQEDGPPQDGSSTSTLPDPPFAIRASTFSSGFLKFLRREPLSRKRKTKKKKKARGELR